MNDTEKLKYIAQKVFRMLMWKREQLIDNCDQTAPKDRERKKKDVKKRMNLTSEHREFHERDYVALSFRILRIFHIAVSCCKFFFLTLTRNKHISYFL